jgi:GxxExxY protein
MAVTVQKENNMSDDFILFKEESYQIQGAIFDVYREMGNGFLEPVYQECLEKELRKRDIPFTAQQELQIYYKGDLLKKTYNPDFICYGKIILELKAVKELTAAHQAQVLNYLKASGLKLGLLINFGAHPKVKIIRLINHHI